MDAALKSLNVDEFVDLKVIEKRRVELTQEGEGYLTNGSAEVQYINALTKGQETPKSDLKLDATIAKVGFQNAMKKKWIEICGEKKEKVKRVVDDVVDEGV